MKIRIIAFLSMLTLGLGLASCIDDEATDDAILSKEKVAIKEYIDSNTLVNVKEYVDEVTGLRVIWQEVSGSGMGVTAGDTLTVDYTGKLLSNKVFDTSVEQVAKDAGLFSAGRKYVPLTFPIGFNFLIPGFEFGVSQMEKGDKATVFVPSMFGYGKQGSGAIPGNAPIIFELDLKEVTQGPKK